MSSVPGHSRSGAAAGGDGDGTGGGGKRPTRSGAAAGGDGDGTGGGGKRPSTSVKGAVGDKKIRHSNGVTLQLRVIAEGVNRLIKERKSLKDVEKYILIAVQELDKEILLVTKMGAIAEMASNFQHGVNDKSLMLEYTKAQPGSSPTHANTAEEAGSSSSSANADDLFTTLMKRFVVLDESTNSIFEDTNFEFSQEDDAFDMEEVLAEIRKAAEPTDNSELD